MRHFHEHVNACAQLLPCTLILSKNTAILWLVDEKMEKIEENGLNSAITGRWVDYTSDPNFSYFDDGLFRFLEESLGCLWFQLKGYFRTMESEIEFSKFTLSTVLKGLANSENLREIQAVHSLVIEIGHELDGLLFFKAMMIENLASRNNLLSGFCDTETCDQGPRIFIQLLVEGFGKQLQAHAAKSGPDDNCSVGAALIDIYAKTSQMQHEGVKPNEFTLASCLSGCSYITALESGQQLHSLTIKSGQLAHTHLAGVLVDIHMGLIEEGKMHFSSLSTVWDYSSNRAPCLYARGMQDEVTKTRALMSKWQIMKEPGCSWVQVDSQPHLLFAQDGSHPKIKEIYQQLQVLAGTLSSNLDLNDAVSNGQIRKRRRLGFLVAATRAVDLKLNTGLRSEALGAL
ncbi:hypothetical protein CK203_013709 [Vitis vinifera]|uniref:Uncharacterized protein n=1 Tax=Vitis vinifera TaxID=29760 RepID=A0A438J905_VITVI|nr:hypothetical protein CK203_013709 [Vitis vinifera]